MYPSRPCLRLLSPNLGLLISLILLTGLSGCGPAASGNAPSRESRASVDGPAAHGASSASGKGTVPGGGKLLPKPAGTPNVETDGNKKSSTPPIPDSIAKDFDSPDPRARLKALDYWATQGTTAPLDPLLEALEDENEGVRTKAAKIAEQHWGIKQELD